MQLCQRLRQLDQPEGGYEVIIVDDRSTDGSEAYLQTIAAVDDRFRVVRGPGRGPAAARNLGIRHARGRLIAFTDADTLPEPAWLVAACSAIRRGKLRALEGAVLPCSDARSHALVRSVRNHDGGRFMTANMVYERALLLEVGGFDETFQPPHFLEDTDLAFRVMDLGVAIPFIPEVAIHHRDLPMTPKQALGDGGKLRWMALLARKHPRRYTSQLRPKIQTLRPGDVDLMLALPLALASRRASWPIRCLAGLSLALAARRVLSVSEFSRARRQRLAWLAIGLIGPALRTANLVGGWIRFKKVAL